MGHKEINDFIKSHKLDRNEGISVLSIEDVRQLESTGHTLEELFDYLTKYQMSLLHGSRIDISDDLLTSKRGEIFCTDLAAIAIQKAIISNLDLKYPGLSYPYFVNENVPLELKIYGINPQTIGDSGFVYIINQTGGFENNPEGSWQYVTKSRIVPISAKIPVKKSDLKHPIFDATNNMRIQ